MVRIGGSTEKGQHIKEHDYYTSTGEFRIDKGGSQILLNCLMYKMCYYRFGSVYTEQGGPKQLLAFIPLSSPCIDSPSIIFAALHVSRSIFSPNSLLSPFCIAKRSFWRQVAISSGSSLNISCMHSTSFPDSSLCCGERKEPSARHVVFS